MAFRKSWLLLAPLLLAGAFLALKRPDPRKAELRAEAQSILAIQLGPGLSKPEAEQIMGFYFQNNISGCGYSGEAVDEGDSWVSFPRAGFAGHPSKDPIRLDKRSGRISWGAGPAYASPKAMTRAALGWF